MTRRIVTIEDILPEIGALNPCEPVIEWVTGHADVRLADIWRAKFSYNWADQLVRWLRWMFQRIGLGVVSNDAYYSEPGDPQKELRAMRRAISVNRFLVALDRATR